MDDFTDVLRASVVIALLGYLENIAIGKAFAQQNGYVEQIAPFEKFVVEKDDV